MGEPRSILSVSTRTCYVRLQHAVRHRTATLSPQPPRPCTTTPPLGFIVRLLCCGWPALPGAVETRAPLFAVAVNGDRASPYLALLRPSCCCRRRRRYLPPPPLSPSFCLSPASCLTPRTLGWFQRLERFSQCNVEHYVGVAVIVQVCLLVEGTLTQRPVFISTVELWGVLMVIELMWPPGHTASAPN